MFTMIDNKFKKHFLVVHNFVSEEARVKYLTPPEKLDPPQTRLTEKQ